MKNVRIYMTVFNVLKIDTGRAQRRRRDDARSSQIQDIIEKLDRIFSEVYILQCKVDSLTNYVYEISPKEEKKIEGLEMQNKNKCIIM